MIEREQLAWTLYCKYVWRNRKWSRWEDMSEWARGYWLGQADLQLGEVKVGAADGLPSM